MQDTALSTSLANRLQELKASALVWDNHTCLPLRADPTFLPQLERFRAAGANIVSINIGFASSDWPTQISLLSFMRRWLLDRPESYRLVAKAADVLACKAQGQLGVTFDLEGMDSVLEAPHLVRTFYDLGVRWMLIAYNRTNAAGGGCMDDDTGLTELGRRIIDEMERAGMVLCLSHAGRRTAADALAYSRNPAIFSHSNPYGGAEHVRNVPDELMLKCAAKGGVIGLSGCSLFLGADTEMVQRLLQHIRYAVDLVGPDHVGLGLDYVFDLSELNEVVRRQPHLLPPGAEHLRAIAPEALDEIIEGLCRANFDDEAIAAILGGNWLRIAQQVWK